MGTKPVSSTAAAPAADPLIDRLLDGVAATAALAADIACHARSGDVIALSGDLGAGKTAFARGFIRTRAGSAALEVPSPTFTLVQTYDLAGGSVWHFDLFRVDRPDEVVELGIEEAFATGIILIEWPERLGAALPDDRLDVQLDFTGAPDRRRARVFGAGDWPERLSRVSAEGRHD